MRVGDEWEVSFPGTAPPGFEQFYPLVKSHSDVFSSQQHVLPRQYLRAEYTVLLAGL